MEWFSLILISIVTGLVYLWWSKKRLPDNFPPGPRGFPVIGCAPFIARDPIHIYFDRLAKRYGGIFHVPLGNRNVVVLNDWTCMKEALLNQSETFGGRPLNFVLDYVTNREDIVSSDGPLWKERRRFALHQLRDLGVGKTSMESIILEEVDAVMGIVDTHGTRKVEMSQLLFIPILNIVWGITAGRKYASDDEKMLTFSKTLRDVFTMFQKCIPVNAIPFLRYLPGNPYQTLQKVNDKVMKFLEDEVDDHSRSYKDGVTRDFIDFYLAEIKAAEKAGTQEGAFQKRFLLGTIYNFFTAGVETTQHTLLWGFLYMATWPEIQEKVHEEIERIIGRDRLPTFSDRTLLPYVEAVLLEIQRFATIVPSSVPHCNLKETQLRGYTIPKRTFISQNLWAVHFDPKLWGDPEVFRPERFIDAAGNVQKPEYLIPFSLGVRQCLGESLAKMELFLFFACILQRYYLRIPTGELPPSFDPIVTVTSSPRPYALAFRRRW